MTTKSCVQPSLDALLELFPILWLKGIKMGCVGLSCLDPAFDAALEGQGLHLVVFHVCNVVCKPS